MPDSGIHIFVRSCVFKDAGLVEQLGSGMSRILRAYDRSAFEISEHFIKVVFPYRRADTAKIIANGDEIGDDHGDDAKVLRVLQDNPSATAVALSKQTGLSTRKISRIVKRLRESGQITRVGSDRKGHWKINN